MPRWTESGHYIEDPRGQKWALPELEFEFWPGVSADGEIEVMVRQGMGPDFDKLQQGLRDAKGPDLIRAVFRAAAYLLQQNYNLDNEDLAPILRARASEPRFQANQQAILEAMYGLPPKPSAVGSPPPSERTASEVG